MLETSGRIWAFSGCCCLVVRLVPGERGWEEERSVGRKPYCAFYIENILHS